MKLFWLAILLLSSTFLVVQNDSTKKWTFSGYGEIYYSYNFANPVTPLFYLIKYSLSNSI